ncbi:hypothetical protein [Galactobacter caseinivorans]|uniref:Uncharacterized protein n=1 Tax=Galactobacter caseinivorans TaxID=2676123 RepID=A0A496PJ03_9MICC|nr:hypothetical protein [Galactobacter caseinivorans]RKW70474.1 hypothetical protein DWQ67_08335 [Galactobacter caseinivorans]
MTVEKNPPHTTTPQALRATDPRASTASLPSHAHPVTPGQERDWPDFPAGGCDPDFPGGSRLRRPSGLNRMVDGLMRAVRG